MKTFWNLTHDFKDEKSKVLVIVLLLFVLAFCLSLANDIHTIGHEIGKALAK